MPFCKQSNASNNPSKNSNAPSASKILNLNASSLMKNNSCYPKPQRRVKRLSNPSEKNLKQAKEIPLSKQIGCPFFERLPGEIRQEIYKYAVGFVFVAEKPFRFWTWSEIDFEQNAQYSELPRDLPISHYGHDYAATEELWGGSTRNILWPLDLCHEVRSRIHHVVTTGKRFKSKPETIIVYQGRSQYHTILGQETKHAGASMLFVCRLMHQETIKLVYSRVTFGLASPRAIHDKFIRRHNHQSRLSLHGWNPQTLLSDSSFRFIQSLCLECPAYNTPRGANASQLWELELEQRYYKRWRLACIELASELTSLVHLRLCISLPGRESLKISAHTRWAEAFLEFSACKTLREVEVWLGGYENERQEFCCEVLAEVLRRKILGWDDVLAFNAVNEAIHSTAIHCRTYVAEEYVAALNQMVLLDFV